MRSWQRLSAIPGVVSVARWEAVRRSAIICEGTDVVLPGRTTPAHVSFHVVTPNYFKTLGIPIERGRDIAPSDRRETAPVMLINEVAARTIWGADDPLKTELQRGDRPTRVVGVVGDVRLVRRITWKSPATTGDLLRRRSIGPGALAMVFIRIGGGSVGTWRHCPTRDSRTRPQSHRHRSEDDAGANARCRVAQPFRHASDGCVRRDRARSRRHRDLRCSVNGRRRPATQRDQHSHGARRRPGTRAPHGACGSDVPRAPRRDCRHGGRMLAARGMASLLYGVSAADASTYAVCAIVLAGAGGVATLIPALRAMATQPASALRGD